MTLHRVAQNIVTRPLCLVESHTLDAAQGRSVSRFTSFPFCKVTGSYILRLNENTGVICYDYTFISILLCFIYTGVICYDYLALILKVILAQIGQPPVQYKLYRHMFGSGLWLFLLLQVGTPIYECNNKCLCGPSCSNRVVQKGQKVKLCIFR